MFRKQIFIPIAFFAASAGCSHGNVSLPEDTSLSGAAAGAVGSALATTNPSGAIPPNARRETGAPVLFARLDSLFNDAWASIQCPTLHSTTGSGCFSVSGTSVYLSYGSCSRGRGGESVVAGTWAYEVSGAGMTVACGAGIGGTGTTYAGGGEFSNATGTAGSTGDFVTAAGTHLTIDDSLGGLSNYQNDSIAPILTNVAPGAGSAVSWSGGVRVGVAVNSRRLVPGDQDYSLSTNGTALTVTEASGATSRTVNGASVGYDNLTKVKGASTFTNVTYEDGCCEPVSGVVSTRFSATSLSGSAGDALNGKTETLTFNGCGTANLTDASGSTSSVAMDWCI